MQNARETSSARAWLEMVLAPAWLRDGLPLLSPQHHRLVAEQRLKGSPLFLESVKQEIDLEVGG